MSQSDGCGGKLQQSTLSMGSMPSHGHMGSHVSFIEGVAGLLAAAVSVPPIGIGTFVVVRSS